MILFWGSKGYQKVLGHTQTTIECGHCNNTDTWEISETGRKFTLYWIPLFPYGKTYFVSCPICHYGKEIQKSDIETYLNYSYLVYKIHVIIKLWHIVQILNNEH